MRTTPRQLMHSLVALTAMVLFAACDNDSPVAPDATLAAVAGSSTDPTAVPPDLGSCDSLAVPAGSELVFHTYARGLQIYRWNGAAWILDGPSATLFADADYRGVVGTHSTGPTWKSNSGSTVKGEVSKRCNVSPDAIQWLLLRAVSTEGRGVFRGVTHIQRVNTVGGKAPAEAGSLNQVRSIPYTAEYFFYRAP